MAYKINQLNGLAWHNAITNVIKRLNKTHKILTFQNDWEYAQEIALEFALVFNENGTYLGMN